MDTIYSLLETRVLGYPSTYGLPKLESIYSVKIELEIKTYVLPKKENKKEKGDLEEDLVSFFRAKNYLTTIPKLN